MAEKHVRNALTGFIMGAISFLPGVSGGFVAMISGIYERLIGSIGDFKKWKTDFVFLATVGACMILGMFVAAEVIEKIYDTNQLQILFFFLGLIVMQLPDVLHMATEKKTDKKISPWEIITFAVGFAIMIAFLFKIEIWNGNMDKTAENFILALFMGIVVGISKVVPGLSWATVFLALGVYTFKVRFVADLNLFFIFAFGSGFVIGIILFSILMKKLIEKYHSETYFLIFGIVVGSVPVIVDSVLPFTNTTEDWLIGILFLILGAILGRIISVYTRKLRAESVDEQ